MIQRVKEFSDYHQFVRDAKVVFENPQGQRVLKYLLKKGCVTTPVAAESRDEALRNEGAQRLMLSLLRAINRSEDEIQQQIQQQT